ncbi:MAG: hypothetical protein WCV68_01930 [Candidatus Paceibacterota bacterium]
MSDDLVSPDHERLFGSGENELFAIFFQGKPTFKFVATIQVNGDRLAIHPLCLILVHKSTPFSQR